MKVRKRVLVLALTLLITMMGISFAVAASVTNTVTMSRGGSSQNIGYDFVADYDYLWQGTINSVSFNGLPTGIWGSNSILVRARAADKNTPASNVITFTSTTTKSQNYNPGYGGYGALQYGFSSLPSSASSSSGTASITFTA